LHCIVPVVHCPHTPALHFRGQSVPLCHVPVEVQVCGVTELHCFVPGTQAPVQAPFTQAEFTQATAAPHWPLGLHVRTPLLEH
jgi:hypothetical protein